MTFLNRILLAPLCAGAMLLGGCFYHPPFEMPDASVIGYDGTHATPPDCRKLAVPAGLSDAGQKLPSVAWGCATYSNLAAQVARPSDLVSPDAVGPAAAEPAVGAIERYRQNKVTPLDTSSSRDTK